MPVYKQCNMYSDKSRCGSVIIKSIPSCFYKPWHVYMAAVCSLLFISVKILSMRAVCIVDVCMKHVCGRLDSAKQLESLKLQLHAIAEQRDNALLQLSSAQDTISSYAMSLSNLQMVLEQFQAGEINDLLINSDSCRPV